MSYDLVEQPWILAQRRDGQVDELSLLDLYSQAGELRTLLGEVPTQSFAIMRLLLAILHRALEGPADTRQWEALWRAEALPLDDISAYLEHFRHRFDLLSPTTPFYQVADLSTTKGEVTGLDRLIADVPTGHPFFTTRLRSGVDRLSFAEAARWVVHCQAFDPSGIKSGAVGDPRVKGGKGYPIGTGWAGMLGGVMVEGRDLRETLLLNLVPDDFLQLAHPEQDLPAWERTPQTAAQEFPDEHVPAGPLELYTWQSRRIRLFYDPEGVYGVLIANGDRMAPQNRLKVEPMSVWRLSREQGKKFGGTVYMPASHDPEMAIWRGLKALLEDTRRQTADRRRPLVLDWINDEVSGVIGDDRYQLRTRAIGMRYGSQSTTTTEVIDDLMTLSVVLLGEAGQELRSTAIAAVGDAEAGANALGILAADLASAAGGEGNAPRDRARELAYAQLDRPFREWLARIGPDTSPDAARTGWHRKAREIISRLGRELVDQAGPVAWRGREVVVGGKKRHISTPEADLAFRRRLRDTFPYAYEEIEVAA